MSSKTVVVLKVAHFEMSCDLDKQIVNGNCNFYYGSGINPLKKFMKEILPII